MSDALILDPIVLDQTDIAARLAADDFFADIPVILERKGITENDIEVALGSLNQQSGKAGAVAIVLMPSLRPAGPSAPGPEYRVAPAVQVIEMPLINLGDTGTGKFVEQIAARVRQLIHYWSPGRGYVFDFAGQDPINAREGLRSYAVNFLRLGQDDRGPKVGNVLISPDEGVAPVEVTLSCPTAGAAMWYTLDGSAPTPSNPAAQLYAAPFNVATAATLRAAAFAAGLDASNVFQATFT
ncbi:MAG: chitobiase/beta-hexosaminidase C-terminal domain-containing protein [Opitutaceae bacterium]|nr:chitobiase/beta-hexosaminidase C-terminal domain-containing protein [Opitutaceae bacterium]